jgi:hypothetical protein
MAWVSHVLGTDPLSLFTGQLFNANILHPSPYSLVCSEHMLGHQPIFGPLYAASGNPGRRNYLSRNQVRYPR